MGEEITGTATSTANGAEEGNKGAGLIDEIIGVRQQ
jgi:hypothetical protein